MCLVLGRPLVVGTAVTGEALQDMERMPNLPKQTDLARKTIVFKQASQLRLRCCIGSLLAVHISAHEAENPWAVVDGVCDALVEQAERLLRHIHSRYVWQINGLIATTSRWSDKTVRPRLTASAKPSQPRFRTSTDGRSLQRTSLRTRALAYVAISSGSTNKAVNRMLWSRS